MRAPESPLELDESQMFEDDEPEHDSSLHGPRVSPSAPAAAHLANASDDGDSDSDDGIVLESECSSSDVEEDEQQLIRQLQSLQSSFENAALGDQSGAAAGQLGTSHSSQVGSLKSFGDSGSAGPGGSGAAGFASYQRGKRLFGSSPDLAASMPVHCSGSVAMPFGGGGRRRVAPAADKASACIMGTSMPISIPMMHRRPLGADLAAADGSGRDDGAAAEPAPAFVPPHVLMRSESDLDGGDGLVSEPSMGALSPTTAAKREKLLARNAILRSTGFIEVQHSAPVIGEVLDPVKDQLLAGVLGPVLSAPVRVPSLAPTPRAAPRSSLTQLLGTSK